MVRRIVTCLILVGIKQARAAWHLGRSPGDVGNRPLPLVIWRDATRLNLTLALMRVFVLGESLQPVFFHT